MIDEAYSVFEDHLDGGKHGFVRTEMKKVFPPDGDAAMVESDDEDPDEEKSLGEDPKLKDKRDALSEAENKLETVNKNLEENQSLTKKEKNKAEKERKRLEIKIKGFKSEILELENRTVPTWLRKCKSVCGPLMKPFAVDSEVSSPPIKPVSHCLPGPD